MDIGVLASNIDAYRERLGQAREAIGSSIAWYPYDILANLHHLDLLLSGDNRDLDRLVEGLPVADIGGADGDLAFVLERECGWALDMIDTAATNMNGLAGARALRGKLQSSVQIWDIDLDSQFRLPAERYGLVLLLGILYHLQNPFYVLRELSLRSTHLLLSTRIARFAGADATPISELPVAYLVGATETNNDATNYWMFSAAGLNRLVERAGWTVLEQASVGDLEASDPSSPDHDERRFMLLRSNAAGAIPPKSARDSRQIPRRTDLRSIANRLAAKTRQLRAGRSSLTQDRELDGPKPWGRVENLCQHSEHDGGRAARLGQLLTGL